ncbi:MAG: transcription termination/antitermination factor NusG [Thermoguttaceae bacterium]|nr:transcription termination/antitermination factor NusG [Kiritimatiellia bacterium]MBO7725177.1 transcription termination/antitermination factor NusG [Thermoguttaceae bacterium]
MAETEKKNEKPVSDEPKKSQDAAGSETSEQDDYVIAPRDWYILKVQVNREESIKRRLQERVNLLKLDNYVTDIRVPKETISVVKNGKKREIGRLLYPGYLIVNMEVNRDTWFLIRETNGIGDFTGAEDSSSKGSRIRRPVPMQKHEVERILQLEKANNDGSAKVQIPFKVGDRVKIKEGSFDGIEGEVTKVDDVTGRVTVIITIFGRSTPVDLEYWQVEQVG